MASLGTLRAGAHGSTPPAYDTSYAGADLTAAGTGSLADDSDSTYTYFADNSNGSYSSNHALDNTPTDFLTMNSLSYVVRFGFTATPSNNDATYAIRIVASDGTVLAADTSGGASQVIATSSQATVANSASTAFNYVNQTASKTLWDGASVQIAISLNKVKGGDAPPYPAVYEASFTGDYDPDTAKTGTTTTSATSAVTVAGQRTEDATITVSHTSATTVAGTRAQTATTSASATSATSATGTTLKFATGTASTSATSKTRVDASGTWTDVQTAVFVAAANSTVNVAQTSLTIDKPAGTLEGHVMVAAISVADVAHASVTGPAGWTKLSNSTDFATGSFSVWTKTAGASEPASYSWTHASSTSVGAILTYSDTSDTLVANPAASTGTSANPDSPASGAIASNSYVVLSLFGSRDGGVTVTSPPSGYTQRAFDTSN